MNLFFYKVSTLSFLLLLSLIYQSSAQAVSGRVIETGGRGIESATITVLNAADSAVVKYGVSNKEGYFELTNLNNGVFTVKVSCIGYNSQLLNNIRFNGSSVKLTDVVLNKQLKELKEVAIASTRPVLERKVDRWIFNLNNTIAANGSSLFEALQVAPFLKVSDNGVSMVGKGSMGVMVNEKIVYLSGTDLTNYLKALRSENVEKIEIITTPPAKYEAQGNAGLINIVLKKNQSLGWRGSVSSTYYQRPYSPSSFNNSLALFFRSKKVSSSFTFNQSIFHSKLNDSLNIIGNPGQILSNEQRISTTPGLQAGLSIDYELNKHNNIGFIYNISHSKEKDIFVNNYSYGTSSTVDSVLNTKGEMARPLFAQTLNLYHDLKIDSAGKKLSSSVNFFRNRPEVRNSFVSESANTYAAVQNNNMSKYDIWSVQSDLTLPYKWAKIETGAKFATYNNNASVAYYNNIHDNLLLDQTRSNDFDYTEKNLAAYYSMESELSKKWTAKAGLRYEYTLMDGYSPTLNQRNKRNYGALFPTAYIVYKADADNTFSLNYSRRINRPGLASLNPFAYYTNIYTYSTGNPLLLPSYSNNFELNYLYKSMFSFTVFTQHTSDVNSLLTTIEGPLVVSSRGNFLTRDNVGAYVSFNRAFFNWWENSSSASFFYSSSASKIEAIPIQNGTSASFSVNNNFKATKLLNFYLNYSQSLPSTSGNTYTYSQRDFRVGARLKLLNNNLIINPTYYLGTVNKYDARFSEFVQTERTDYHYRIFSLGLTYLFGRSKVSGNNKNISFDEKRRAQ
ncbi:TonB-dependent receptor family protein [Mucilaginibacter sp. BJC16-A38]|uniref:outer membrane beta-barrel family protein n=1 Tax=Mucilaginibacter phenanthrenivorans TaxID=1234842 RepID=UPI0021576610|nr:outer membrane beta-barrel family protein [Mucilaginibacter phenanthrenivorans]MCR8559234.1 TonB-dependent receptor family protein [Mucilaginibacter phenanthrenivorans]